jgi:hypothetical protein
MNRIQVEIKTQEQIIRHLMISTYAVPLWLSIKDHVSNICWACKHNKVVGNEPVSDGFHVCSMEPKQLIER